MSVERQQGGYYQRRFDFDMPTDSPRPDVGGDGGIEAAAPEESQSLTALNQARALTARLMEEVTDRKNVNRAYRRVKANKGAPGVDGMTVDELGDWINQHQEQLIASLLDGSYQPQPVRGVEIPKAGGGVRQLGIPTVVDRLVQQAILQVLEPILDPTFSASSFGFRPGRGAHDALHQARRYVAEGRMTVVDLDLEKFFDRVNHDILMGRLARRIADKHLLRIIRRFLEAGILQQGVCVERNEGTPQGGPIAPPTKVQNFSCASFLRKKGEVDPVNDSYLFAFDHHSRNQGAQDLSACWPIGRIEVVADHVRETIQASQCFT